MKTKEFFSSQGEPENDTERELRFEREAREKLGRVDRLSMDPEMRRYLDETDFTTIRNIFWEDAKHSGISSDGLHITAPDRISPVVSLVSTGISEPFLDIVGVDFVALREIYRGLNMRLVFLRILIHELVHSASGTKIYGNNPHSGRFISGFSYNGPIKNHPVHKGYAQDHREELFRGFDEGMTEKMARIYFEEYIRRTNTCTFEELQEFNEEINKVNAEKNISYNEEVTFVDWMIAKISRATGFDKKTVWQSLLQSKYRGEIFEDPEVRAGFEEIFGPEFLKKLSNEYASLSKLKAEFDAETENKDLVSSVSLKQRLARFMSLVFRFSGK